MREAYRQKDVEFPVRVGMQNFMADKPQAGGQRFDRDGLYRWSAQRLGTVLAARKHGPAALSDQRPASSRSPSRRSKTKAGRKSWCAPSRGPNSATSSPQIAPKAMPAADIDEIDAKVEEVFSGAKVAEAEDAKELVEWVRKELGLTLDAAEADRPHAARSPAPRC